MKKIIYTTCLAVVMSTTSIASAQAITFQDSLKSAYENNSTLNSARANVRANDERVRQAIGGFLPDIDLNYSKIRLETDVTSRSTVTKWGDNRSASITQPLFNGGSTYARTEAAMNQVYASREELLDVEQDTLLDAVSAYNDVIRDMAVLELNKSNRDVLKKRLDMTSERFKVGELTRTDVAQSQARLASAVASISQAEANLEASKAQFKKVVGIDAAGIEPTSPVLGAEPKSLAEAIEVALANNPNIKAAMFQKKASKYDTNAAIGDILPDVRLSASKTEQNSTSAFINGSTDEKRLSLNVNIPLYQNGGVEYSRLRASRQLEEKRKFDIDAANSEITRRVTEGWERLMASRSTIQSIKEAVKAAELAVEGSQMEADLGTRTTLEVLDTQQELFTTKVNLVRAERDSTVAYYTLLAHTGMLTANKLGIDVVRYDPVKNYNKIKYHF